jgi:acetolactate synthase I/II/III large subunit
VQFDLPQSETTKQAADLPSNPSLMPALLRPEPEATSLRPAVDRIDAARKPIILAGLGVLWDRASAELVRFAEHLGAPVLVTSKCKGVIPEDHPLRAGCIIGGLIERKLVMQADIIITVGLDGVEFQPKPWPYQVPVIALSSIGSLDALVPAQMEAVGDLKAVLKSLATLTSGGAAWGEKAAATFRRDVVDALNTPSRGLSPQRAMEVARAVLPREAIATCDAGASRLLVVQKWQSYGPREFLTSNGLGSMGYAVPGALGARMAYPDRPVVAFTGDGGFLMAVAELQTSVREKLPAIVVVFDDQEIGLIRVKQEIKGLPPRGVGIGGCAWDKIAEGFGADGVVVDSENSLGDALAVAVRSGRTTVIGVRIDGSGYVAQFNALREL